MNNNFWKGYGLALLFSMALALFAMSLPDRLPQAILGLWAILNFLLCGIAGVAFVGEPKTVKFEHWLEFFSFFILAPVMLILFAYWELTNEQPDQTTF